MPDFSSTDTADAQPPEVVTGHRFGFVTLCGRPNVGKSTLLNALMGDGVAVTSAYPQTTRERMLGIWSEREFQAVLVDTPGIHRPRSELNRFMVDQSMRAVRDVDMVLCLAETPALVDSEQAMAWRPGEVALDVWHRVSELGRPAILVLTKIDRLKDNRWLLPVIATWAEITEAHPPIATIPTSAVTGVGLDALKKLVVEHLPEAPPHYDRDQLTDRNLRWHAAELTRAVLFDHLADEIPYSCAVVIDSFLESPDRDAIQASIYVERNSQKGIVIGQKGAKIRAVRQDAAARIERLTGRTCDLRLRVGVVANWTRDPGRLRSLGYYSAEER